MGLLSFFKPKTQADKNLPVNHRTRIITDPRRTGITPEYITPAKHMFPRELYSLIEYEVPESIGGIHVEYDSLALDHEWDELIRQSVTNAAMRGESFARVSSTPSLQLELIPLDEVKPFEAAPTKRARHENL